ncbi:CxxxxCH/CxxCH domain-containing protein [Geobacter sp. DSM 9736]|uniref:CxxxxCH/CxxCH domain c-type cytochrome n=1 Tax=Geobacter sp. DSM 9736 TaxID=1277350 RepID=UPI000B51171E|nr:CxxxxCH/CxxCH domain-containing protein [Geobacter sp. DSM 9736]SNB45999.1 Geobacter sulfurreducens CxxxxCH...CXXCH domain-containing protein [Geobacter sp. DSM 9736]
MTFKHTGHKGEKMKESISKAFVTVCTAQARKGSSPAAMITVLIALLTLVATWDGTAGAVDLLHNSADTGSTKWPQGWGVPGGKYGEFTCQTCHQPGAPNIKNVRGTIRTPNGENWPNGASSVTVSFLNTSSMGQDRGGHADSNRICEVCHSKVQFHNSDTANNTGGLEHPTPQAKCTSCHYHNTGFKAACGGCHGNPPTTAEVGGDYGLIGTPRPSNAMAPGLVGAHATHTQARAMVCDTCHYISNGTVKMPNLSNTIDIGFFGFGGKITHGTYIPYSSSNRGYRFSSGTVNTTVAAAVNVYGNSNICSNVYCHGGGVYEGSTEIKAPLTGGTNTAPRWDAANQNSCGSCHGTTSANPPTMGSHVKHSASTGGYGFSCDLCHPVSGDNSHVQGNVRWAMKTTDPRIGNEAAYDGLASGSTGDLAPSASYRQCSNVTCHSDGKGGAGRITPTWGASLPSDCSACHGGTSGGNRIATGAHYAHIEGTKGNYTCERCHINTMNPAGDNTLNPATGTQYHVNGTTEVTYNSFNSSTIYSGETCSNVYCHSFGTAATAPFRVMSTATWSGTLPANCTGCHGGAGATSSRFRVMSTGRHQKHMRGTSFAAANTYYSYSCSDCHNTTVSGNTTVTNPGNHINYQIEVAFAPTYGGTYPSSGHAPGVDATRTCANVYCHSNAQTGGQAGTTLRFRNLTGSKTWYGTSGSLGCTGCHNYSSNSAGLSGKHGVHVSATINPSIGTGISCYECHAQTRTSTGWNDRNKHADRFINYSGTKAGGQANLNVATGVCSTVFCHSDGKGVFKSLTSAGWFSSTTLNCTGCHGSDAAPAFVSVAGEPNYATAGGNALRSNSHRTHSAAGASTCDTCHTNTVTTTGTAIKSGGLHLDRFIDVNFNTAKATASWDALTRTCNNISCHGGANAAWGDPSSAGCNVCHASLSATHAKHIGDLISSRSVTFYNFTAIRSAGSAVRIGCANCHPTDLGKHRNGTVDLTINRSKAGASYITTLNLATADGIGVAGSGIAGTTGANVNCLLSYCHSSGKSTALAAPDFKASPDWYGTPPANRCGMCHDNPPQYAGQSHYVAASTMGDNGTLPVRDSGHMVGIHYRNTYRGSGQNGFLGYSSSGDMAHGNPAYATTVGCYICHSGIVSSTQVDTYAMHGSGGKFDCSRCHTASTRTPLQPGLITDTARHINGKKDVAFPALTFKTKAQLSNVANALGWTRNGSYKTAGSYDSMDLGTSTWDPATKTCLTACHVNQPGITWGGALKCVSCHANQ